MQIVNSFILLFVLFPAFAFSTALPVELVAPGVYVHRGVHRDINVDYGGDICNISFVIGSKGVAVIDTGGSPKTGARLREAGSAETKDQEDRKGEPEDFHGFSKVKPYRVYSARAASSFITRLLIRFNKDFPAGNNLAPLRSPLSLRPAGL